MPEMENLLMSDSHIAQIMSGLVELTELAGENVEVEIAFREAAIQILKTAVKAGLISLSAYGHIIKAAEEMNEEQKRTL
jgi:hypothetical protein